MTWQLQDAKNRFSEVVETSRKKGPQIITRRGHNTTVVMSFEEFQRLTKPKKDLKWLLRNSGFNELDLARDKSTTGRATPVDFNSSEFSE